MRGSRLCLGTLLGVSLTLVTPAVAFPDHYDGATGQNGMGCDPPRLIKAVSKNLKFWYDDLGQGNEDAVQNVRLNDVEPTQMDTSMDSSLQDTTDVLLRDDSYTNQCGFDWWDQLNGGVVGLATCRSLNNDNECRSHLIRMSTTFTQAHNAYRRALACHEIGHAMGLNHNTRPETCIGVGALDLDHDYSDHDGEELANHY